MTSADKWIRYITIAAVAAVGLAAAVLSYRHQFDLAANHGESAVTAKLLPISIDGLLVAGSLAVLDASRRDTGHAWPARMTVGLGVAMTMWANIVHGLGFGWAGIVLSGWPPVALMAAIEVLARMVRPAPEVAPEAAPVVIAPEAAPEVLAPVLVPAPPAVVIAPETPAPKIPAARRPIGRPTNVTDEAAMAEFETDLAAGSVPALREIRRRLPVGQTRAEQIQAHLASAVPAPA